MEVPGYRILVVHQETAATKPIDFVFIIAMTLLGSPKTDVQAEPITLLSTGSSTSVPPAAFKKGKGLLLQCMILFENSIGK